MYYDVCNVSCEYTDDGYFCLFQMAQTGFFMLCLNIRHLK